MKRISISEFREIGFLQEANRQFFHPLGFALEVVLDDSGDERLGGIWDCRDDLEGIVFDEVDAEKAQRVIELQGQRAAARREGLGFVIQPIGEQAKQLAHFDQEKTGSEEGAGNE